ncbi:MAG: ribose-phosphate diphosphokinase [Candidatus Acetothermia bacterium]
MGQLKLVTGNSNRPLAEDIASTLNLELCEATVGRFPDGEIQVHIEENVRGCNLFVIQSHSPPVNQNVMELLLLIDALKRASAHSIAAVIPYYGYARQDRKQTGRVPISAKLVANMISTAGADRVLTIDLHAGQIQGFFDIPVDNLRGDPVLADYFSEYQGAEDVVVVSPDVGGAKRARKVAQRLNVSLAIAEKKRDPTDKTAEIMNLIGEIENKKCLVVDDLASTGGTLIKVSEALEDRGCQSVEAICTHGLFADDCLSKLRNSPISRIAVTDTILHEEARKSDFVDYVPVGPLFAATIQRIYENKSVSALFPHS